MPDESEGLRIARERIIREKEERTGFLDLGELGLQSWPEELWELTHLTELNLSWGWYDKNGEWHRVKSDLPANRAAPGKMRWAGFPNLRRLHISELAWTDLSPLRELASLRFLDCSLNRITTLEPLAGLTTLRSLDLWGNPVRELPEKLIRLESLNELVIPGSALAGIPAETLSRDSSDDCLERLRAWLRER